MSNQNTPSGFRPVENRNGSPYCGITRTVIIPAAATTAFFSGDFVSFTGEQEKSDVDGTYYETVALSSVGGDRIAGAITGISTIDVESTQFDGHRTAGAKTGNVRVQIPMDRDVIYEAQEDSDGGALSTGDAQRNVNFVIQAGDATTNTSGWEIDSSTVTDADTASLRLMKIGSSITNESGVNAKWYVAINLDAYNSKVGA